MIFVRSVLTELSSRLALDLACDSKSAFRTRVSVELQGDYHDAPASSPRLNAILLDWRFLPGILAHDFPN